MMMATIRAQDGPHVKLKVRSSTSPQIHTRRATICLVYVHGDGTCARAISHINEKPMG